jgi:hypothetical protein
MQSGSTQKEKRRQDRKKAVLPIRVRGNDASGKRFEDLAHTLDITPAGARLAGIRHVLKLRDRITVTYRQRRIDFQVMWTKQIEGTGEYQVGIKAMAQGWRCVGAEHCRLERRSRKHAIGSGWSLGIGKANETSSQFMV